MKLLIFCTILVNLSIITKCYKIEPKIIRHLSQNPQDRIDIFISLKNGEVEPVLRDLSRNFHIQRISKFRKPQAVYSELKYFADQTQRPILNRVYELAREDGASVHSLWIVNKIFIRSASRDLIDQLSQISNIQIIEQDKMIDMGYEPDPIPTRKMATKSGKINVEWGVKYIGASQVWEMGYEGQGVTVGILDSGVMGDHPDLVENYVGLENNGWFNPIDFSEFPHDDYGHGTHVMGTICGRNGIGVAPKAKWIACGNNNGNKNISYVSSMIMCGQFMVCPTRPDGSEPDCSKAPQVINNSWGDNYRPYPEYAEVINGWKTAGIIPTFSAGNVGFFGCKNLNTFPQMGQDVFVVGSIDSEGNLANSSSKGPKKFDDDGAIKPDIVAPGVEIMSSLPKDPGYGVYSGTSMATPHVTGVIALMLSKNPNLSYEDVMEIIQNTADHENLGFKGKGQTCGGIDYTEFPNFHFGHGVINALKAIEAI